jgi:glycosyltransferase involved in cell wall biosynthesis
MPKEDLVSVLMPVYNCADFLEQSIFSILKQTHKNLELLIVNDCSKDKSWEIISAMKDNRIRKYNFTKNKGNIVALNFLLEKAEGKFITFQDADDWSDINRIKVQIDFFRQHPQIYLCGTEYRYVQIDNTFTQASKLPLSHEGIMDYINEFEFPSLCAASCMIRKEVYEKVGGFREYFNRIGSGDFDWHYRIIEKYKIANIDEILYYYRKNNLSLTNTVSKDLKKMISYKIANHLYKQRKIDNTDSIINEDFEAINEFTKKLLPEYFKDSGLIYFKIAENQIINNQLLKGFISTMLCILRKPIKRRNFTLLKSLIKKI